MALLNLDIPKDYSDGSDFTEAIMDGIAESIEAYALRTNRNLDQLRLDLFGSTYSYNNSGVATRSDPIVNSLAVTDLDTEITGDWSFTSGADLSGSALTLPSTFTVDQTSFDYIVSFSNPAANRLLTVPDPGANASFILSNGTQTINGALTLASTLDVDGNVTFDQDLLVGDDLTAIGDVIIGGAITTGNNITASGNKPGDDMNFSVINTSGVSGSAAKITVQVAADPAGDPMILLKIASSTEWHMGIDNSDDKILKIGHGGVVGTNALLEMHPVTEHVLLHGTVEIDSDDLTISGAGNGLIISQGNISANGTLTMTGSGLFGAGNVEATSGDFLAQAGDFHSVVGDLLLDAGVITQGKTASTAGEIVAATLESSNINLTTGAAIGIDATVSSLGSGGAYLFRLNDDANSPVNTGVAGAYYGRIKVIIGSTVKYIHVFDP